MYFKWFTAEELCRRENLCEECDSASCVFANKGICCYSLVNGSMPIITEEDGCLGYYFDEQEL